MKIKKHANGNVILIDDAGKEINRVPSDWMLFRDLKNSPMYFYASPSGSNGGGVVIEWAKVTHLIKGTTESAWSGTADQLFTELSDNFFIKVSGGGSTDAPVVLRNNDEIVQFGDSITAYGNNTGNPYFDSWGFTTWLNLYTGGRLLLPAGGNKGVGGNTTVQMIARLGAALALKPKVTTIIAGTNDIAILGSPAATIQANLKIIVDAFLAVNSVVIIGTILPRYGSSALTAPQEVIRQTVNAYIITLASDRVKVVNNETVMAGAGNYQSDGLHPNTLGAQKLGLNMAAPINALLPVARITDFIAQDNALTANIALSGTTGGVNGATGQVATSYTLNASNSGAATVVGSKTTTGAYNQQIITISGNKTAANKMVQFGVGGFATSALTAGSISNSFLDFELLTAPVNIKGFAISTNYNGSSGYLADSYSYFPIDSVMPVFAVGRYQLRGFNFVAPSGVTSVDMFVTIFLADGSVPVSGQIKIWKAVVQKVG